MMRVAAFHELRKVITTFSGLCAAFVAGTATLLLATACWMPTFDPDVSGSELTVRKLGEPVAWFTLEDIEMDKAESFWFLPQRQEVPPVGSMYGLLISERGSSLSFASVQFEPEFDYAYKPYSWDRITNTFGAAYFAQVTPDGNQNATIVAELPFIHTITLNPFASTHVDLPADSIMLGFGAVARPLSDVYELTLLNREAAPPEDPHSELIGWTTNPPTINDPSPVQIEFPASSSVKVPGKFLYFGATSYYYLSCGLVDGSRTIFRWSEVSIDTIPPIEFPEDHGPLIGGLADGRLLAEEDGLISVLSPDLELLFTFRSGSLRFVHERYDAVELKMISVFTRTLYARGGGSGGDRLRVEIFEIPSSELSKLGD